MFVSWTPNISFLGAMRVSPALVFREADEPSNAAASGGSLLLFMLDIVSIWFRALCKQYSYYICFV